MPLVNIEGIFMGANVKESTFDGVTKSALYIDVYQPASEDAEKTVQLKSEDMKLLTGELKDYMLGVPFSCVASVNAYKNKAYFKLKQIK